MAAKYKVSQTTILRVLKSDPEMVQKVSKKKEENTKSILEHMDTQKNDICVLLDKLLEALGNEEKIKKTPLNQIATTLGIVIDKYTATESHQSRKPPDNNLLDAINGSIKEGEFNDISELQ